MNKKNASHERRNAAEQSAARRRHAERGRWCSFAAHDRPRGFAAGTPAQHLLSGAHERSAADWSRMQQTRGLSTGQTRAECSRYREVRAVLRCRRCPWYTKAIHFHRYKVHQRHLIHFKSLQVLQPIHLLRNQGRQCLSNLHRN